MVINDRLCPEQVKIIFMLCRLLQRLFRMKVSTGERQLFPAAVLPLRRKVKGIEIVFYNFPVDGLSRAALKLYIIFAKLHRDVFSTPV